MPTKDFLEDKQQVTLYPTKAQHKKLKELAAKRGKNLSTYILDSAFRDEKIHEKLDKIIGMLEGKPYIMYSEGFDPLKYPEEPIECKCPPTIHKLKETVKQMERPTFFKGGK